VGDAPILPPTPQPTFGISQPCAQPPRSGWNAITLPPHTHGAEPTLAVKPRDSPDPGPQARRRARGAAHGALTHETLRSDDGTRNVHARTNVQPRTSDQHHQRPAHTTTARVGHEQGTDSTEPLSLTCVSAHSTNWKT
jgi:hypothetical protein